MAKPDDALTAFNNGFTCSSAVFSAFADDLGLTGDLAKKISCGFGAGVSRTGNICGAVSGAILAIGLKYGKAEVGDSAANEKTRALVRQFIDEFIEKNGSINCTGLLGYDLSEQNEYDKARAENLFATKCPEYVKDAAAILERLL
ncbi:C-GCAxxG-C-C family protein [Methanocalculus sp. MC3]